MRKKESRFGKSPSLAIPGNGIARFLPRARVVIGATLAFLAAALMAPLRAAHAGAGPITYVYDSANRLIEVADGSGAAAFYQYDAVGNLLSISASGASQVEIFQITPTSGRAGTSVTLYGSNFSPTSSQDMVSVNGAAAVITSAAQTTIVFTVPSTTCPPGGCPVSVTAPAGTSNSVIFNIIQ